MVKSKKRSTHHKLFLAKEVMMAVLSLLSIVTILFEFISNPDIDTLTKINQLDMIIAYIFLFDFCASLVLTGDRKKYLRHNWYFLFAAIPISDSIAELFRGIRILRFIRLIRAGEHLDFAVTRK